MKNNPTRHDLADEVINAFGSPHFNADEVVNALRRLELEAIERSENPGSIRAVMNALPSITEAAKKLY